MGKRKVSVSEDEEEGSAEYSGSESSSSDPKSKGKKKAKPSVKKPTYKKEKTPDDESESESDRPVVKKAKREKKKDTSENSSGIKVLKGKDGDKYIDLGKKKHATVRTFKGMQLLDIREFYDAGGEDKPGKKGISLSLDQWNTLKAAGDTIDKLFSETKK